MAKKRSEAIARMLPNMVRVIDRGKTIGWLQVDRERNKDLPPRAYGLDGRKFKFTYHKIGGEGRSIPDEAYATGAIHTVSRFSDGEIIKGWKVPMVRRGERVDPRTVRHYVVLPDQTVSAEKLGEVVAKMLDGGMREVQLSNLYRLLSRL